MINIIDFQVIINKENPAILKNIAVPKAQMPLFHVKKACFFNIFWVDPENEFQWLGKEIRRNRQKSMKK